MAAKNRHSLDVHPAPHAAADLVEAYKTEIESFAQANHVQQAVERLLDFAKEFSPDSDLVNRAILASANFQDLRQQMRIAGVTPTTTGARNGLIFEILQLKDEITNAFERGPKPDLPEIPPPPLHVVSTKPALPSPEPEEDGFGFETELNRARRRFIDLRHAAGDPESDAMVACRCRGLGKRYRRRFRRFQLTNISLELRVGEITGLVGVNGSGKSTLMEIIRGAMQIGEGELTFPALTQERDDWETIRRQIAFVPQHLKSWPGYVVDNLHLRAAHVGIKGKENEDEVEWLLHRLDLTDFRRARWEDLSGGYRMRFALARALLSRPRLLVLDEPLAHLDIIAQQVFLRDLKAIALSAENPIPILVSSQHLYEIESISDRLLFLNNGKVVFHGTLKELERQRGANYVELSSDATLGELRAALNEIADLGVEPVGLYSLLTLPLTTSVESSLTQLTARGIRLRYFRDISGSTVNLFRTQVEREDP